MELTVRRKKVVEGKGKLLGVTHDNVYLYLNDFSFDCGWYWGGGYIAGYKNNCNYESSHQHFNTLFFEGRVKYIEAVQELFKWTTLNKEEWWKLLELMKCFYSYRQAMDVAYRGSGGVATVKNGEYANKDLYELLDTQIQKHVIKEIDVLYNGTL